MFVKSLSFFRSNYYLFYISLLAVFLAVLPHSRLLLSMSEIGLVLFWILEGRFNEKLLKLKRHPEIIVFVSIWLLHIVGLIYTENFSYALKDLRIKLPILIFPLVLGTSPKIKFKELKILLIVFSISLFAKSIYGIFSIENIFIAGIDDLHRLAGKFSHIRYALLLNIAAFSNLFLLIYSEYTEKLRFKIFYLFAFLWLSFFMFFLHSVTGWVIWTVLIFSGFIYFIFKSENKTIKILAGITIVGLLFFLSFYIFNSVKKFYKTDKINFENLDKYTSEGNLYQHSLKYRQTENGHYVNLYFCEKEIKEEWNKRSKLEYGGKDKKGQPLKSTLIRYMTSKNLRKDKGGVLMLSRQDIRNIENGMTNYIFGDKFSLYPKIYEILWQIRCYDLSGEANNQSVSQRLEFLKNAKEIIKRNFWIGVGTGDVADEFKKQYELSDSKLTKKHRLRSHNQYVTIFVTFGLFGFVWFLFAYLYPGIKLRKFKNYLFLMVFIVTTLSMLNEDVLETQMGATVFAFFLSFFLFTEEK